MTFERSDPDTAIGGTHDRFPSTQLSLLEATTAGVPNSALERVAGLYWKPVYRFIRLKFRKGNEDAKDLTQSFFATAIQREFFARFDPEKGSFRTYLRMAVERFAASEHAAANRQRRGGGVVFESVDDQPATTESPEDVFEREWQRQLFVLGLEDLRALCEERGKQIQFRIFEVYDLTGGDHPSYAELAVIHGIAETSVTNHLAWARRMLRTSVTGRLRAVTSGERELREEMRWVWN
jgi:RNA polymerase sigma-70 factor (ECF subfamily)